ncbi:helix-turn-helix domain-containing protein [Actinoallomurus vinaceus]|uniref:Helix-turn-helix domain-containing protein n=1 Tax=Actinoallomurus vinaceus TaxID=1080074 RepID=A0ABP8U811_9ACTN
MTERSEGAIQDSTIGHGADEGGAVTIGGTLAKAREEAGLTVPQVAGRTCIRETVINAIERDDFSMCGGNFYSRGHIRSIARAVGIDPEPLVQDYDDAHGGSPQAVSAREVFEAKTPVKILERRSPNWTAAMAAAMAIVVIYGIFRVATGEERHKSAERAAAPAAPTQAAIRPSRSAAVAQAPRKEVTVSLKAKRASWLSVQDAKGKQLFSGVIRPGQSEEWTAKKRILLVIGNGGGVHLTVNGKNVGSPGQDGQVVRLSFGPGDPQKG